MKFQFIVIVLVAIVMASCSDQQQAERLLKFYLNRHEARVKPIVQKYNEAVWNTYSGKSTFTELFDQGRIMDSMYIAVGEPAEYYQNLLNNVYNNTSDFEMLQKIKESGLIGDTLLQRQFIKVFRDYVTIESNWDDSEKRRVDLYEQFFDLKRSENAFWDSIRLVNASDASKQWIDKFSGLNKDFRSMIKALNRDSKKLGYENYYQLVLDFNGVDFRNIESFISLIDEGTRTDFKRLLDLAKDKIQYEFQISEQQISSRYYNYEFRKMMIPSEWDTVYSHEDFLAILRDFFDQGGFEIDDILVNSYIWEAEGKLNQSFFFCSDLDMKDYRIYSNSKSDIYGLMSLLHEFGHAVHYKSIDADVPYFLIEPNTITAEAVAIYFGNKIYHSESFRQFAGIQLPKNNSYFNEFSDPSGLIFLRRLLRNIQFEKAIFENPDQDFNQLWWNLSEKYLLVNVSEADRLPEWISNYHIIAASGVQVFYLYASAFAAQLEAHYPDVQFSDLKQHLLKYGDAVSWSRLVEISTGEPLNLNYLFNSYRRKRVTGKPIFPAVSETGNRWIRPFGWTQVAV